MLLKKNSYKIMFLNKIFIPKEMTYTITFAFENDIVSDKFVGKYIYEVKTNSEMVLKSIKVYGKYQTVSETVLKTLCGFNSR